MIWFFGQFIYTSAFIILISATASQLIVFNFLSTTNGVLDAISEIGSLQNSSFPNRLGVYNLPEDDVLVLNKSGIAAADILDDTYQAIANSNGTDAFDPLSLRQYFSAIQTVATQYKLQPEPTEPLYWFLLSEIETTDVETLVNDTFPTLNELYRDHLASVTWFPGAGGATLIINALLRYCAESPGDKWDWANIMTIGGGGVGYTLLSILDINSGGPIFKFNDTSGDLKISSPVYAFADSGLVLPSFAILNLLVLLALGIQHHYGRLSSERKVASQKLNTQEPLEYDMRMDSTEP